MSKCDLHIHSRFSARSEEWLFRRFDFPDSYSDPRELHRQLLEREMDFVTITDHDTIDGCLEIRDLPNTFISEQVTTYFPQDPCKIHILAWGITEKQHDDIVIIRDNIFALQKYLQSANIAHAVAHPLYSINGKLEASHLERLILLFKHFEGINGLRDALLSELAQQLFGSLSPEKIEELAKKHNLAPTHEQAWKKIVVGGSDDHGGQFIASAFTETPRADSTDKFLEYIRASKCQAHGHGGTPLALSHGFYNTVALFIQDHLHEKLGPSAALVEQMFSRFMEGRDPTELTLTEKARLFGQAEMTGKIPEALQNKKRAWFTDTLEDVNGVATTIRKMTAAGAAAGKELIVITSRNELMIDGIPIKNFRPIGEFELPEYELQKLSFPPILQMLDYIQRERFTEVIISTPGPIGLTALLAAKMLNLQTSGIYHTDFPQYVRILTEDSFLESVTWRYMHWFYGQLDTVFVNSEEYRESWIKRGFDPAKLKIFPRGLDTELFHPTRRNPAFFEKFGAKNGQIRLLYVGRVSREKDLDLLAEAYRRLRDEGLSIQLCVVGHGPYSKEFSESLPEALFTGYLTGKELAVAYASADIFVFPSTTDTFGNVIIEAQASGVPVIVSDSGGPKELVEDNENGLITKSHDVEDFVRDVRTLIADPALRERTGNRDRHR